MFTSRADLDDLLKRALDADASDVHLGPGYPPKMRCDGKFKYISGYPNELTTSDMDIILENAYRSATGPSSVQGLEDLDFSYAPARSLKKTEDKNNSLYRVNASSCTQGIRMVFRRLPAEPPTFEQIEAPDAFMNVLKHQRQGLILVTGPTGSGKSTTLAAGVRYLLEAGHSLHIITLENPVEFRYDSLDLDAAYITQRELNRSLKDFTVGMKSALRQDPDVILVGEMRDLETIRLAMEAADTGHLVLGTVHTTDVPSTISRIVQMFPTEEQVAARVQLLGSLRFILCQRLLPRKPKKRVAAREYLELTPSLRSQLIELPPGKLVNALADATLTQGITMMNAVRDLHNKDLITDEVLHSWELILQEESTTLNAAMDNKGEL